MVSPVLVLAGASAAAKGLGSLLNAGAAKKAEKVKQQLRNDFTTKVQAPAFDFRLLTQQQGNEGLSANQRENIGAQDRIIRQAQTDNSGFLDQRLDNQIGVKRNSLSTQIDTSRAALGNSIATDLKTALTRAGVVRANQGADETAAITQVNNATAARQGKTAAWRKAQDDQYAIQDTADLIGGAFMDTLGVPQNTADRAAATTRRNTTLAQALTAPTLFQGSQTGIADDVVKAEFERRNQQGADRARSEAQALNEIKAYGDASIDAGIRQGRFSQDLATLGIKSDLAKGALPYQLNAFDTKQGADDASASATRDIVTAFTSAMGGAAEGFDATTGAARGDFISSNGQARLDEIGAVGQTRENSLATLQGVTADTHNAILGTSGQKYATLADALRGYTTGVVGASDTRESNLGNLVDAQIAGTYGTNKAGQFLSTAGDVGMTVASIMAGMPKAAVAAPGFTAATPATVQAGLPSAIKTIRGPF